MSVNFTEPTKAHCIKQDITNTAYIINGSITLILSIFCILGNGSLVLVFMTSKSVRNLNNRAVILLFMNDLYRALGVMATKIVTNFGHIDHLPHAWCSITAFICGFTFFFNPMILALIACIRYFVIVPWTKRAQWLTLPRFYMVVLTIFGISILFSVLPFLGVGVYEFSKYHGVCFANWDEKNRAFRSIFYIFVIGIAFPILLISYGRLLFMLKQHNRQVKAHLPSLYNRKYHQQQTTEVKEVFQSRSHDYNRVAQDEATVNTDVDHEIKDVVVNRKTAKETSNQIGDTFSKPLSVKCDIVKEDTDRGLQSKRKIAFKSETTFDKNKTFVSYVNVKSDQKNRLKPNQNISQLLTKQEYKITKLMFYICLAYIICWFPAAVVNILALIDTCNVPEVWYLIIVTMVELKTCLNPLIYGLGNRQFREKIKHFLKRYCKR